MLVLTTTRTNWFNETVVGGQSDYHRAYAAAEALISDAETDIRGKLPGGPPITPNDAAFFFGSGRRIADPHFPLNVHTDLDPVIAAIGVGVVPCRRGICVPPNEQALGNAWWDNPVTFAAMTAGAANTANAVAATYGEFTGANAAAGCAEPPAHDHSQPRRLVLGGNTAIRGVGQPCSRWLAGAGRARVLSGQPYFFRITAVVQGQKPGTRVVLENPFHAQTRFRELIPSNPKGVP